MNRIVRWMNIRWVNCSHLDDACDDSRGSCALAVSIELSCLVRRKGRKCNERSKISIFFFYSRGFYKSLILKKLKFKQRENYEFKDCYFFDA